MIVIAFFSRRRQCDQKKILARKRNRKMTALPRGKRRCAALRSNLSYIFKTCCKAGDSGNSYHHLHLLRLLHSVYNSTITQYLPNLVHHVAGFLCTAMSQIKETMTHQPFFDFWYLQPLAQVGQSLHVYIDRSSANQCLHPMDPRMGVLLWVVWATSTWRFSRRP